MIKIVLENDQTLDGDILLNGTYKTKVYFLGVKLWDRDSSTKNKDVKVPKKNAVGFG